MPNQVSDAKGSAYGATIAGKHVRLRDFAALERSRPMRDPRPALRALRPGDVIGFWLYDGPEQTGTPMSATITRVLGPNRYEGRMRGVKPYGGSRVVFGRRHVSHLNGVYLYESRASARARQEYRAQNWSRLIVATGLATIVAGAGYWYYRSRTSPRTITP